MGRDEEAKETECERLHSNLKDRSTAHLRSRTLLRVIF